MIIILVILLVAAAAAVTLLIFKIKDMTDAADFSDAEEAALAEEEWTDPRPAEVRVEDRHLRAAEPRVARK